MDELGTKKETLTATSYKSDIGMLRSSFSTEFIIDMLIHIQLMSDTIFNKNITLPVHRVHEK